MSRTPIALLEKTNRISSKKITNYDVRKIFHLTWCSTVWVEINDKRKEILMLIIPTVLWLTQTGWWLYIIISPCGLLIYMWEPDWVFHRLSIVWSLSRTKQVVCDKVVGFPSIKKKLLTSSEDFHHKLMQRGKLKHQNFIFDVVNRMGVE